MKKFKKLSALLLAAIMILTMAVPALAEEVKVGTVNGVPSSADKGTLKVKGVEGENATVTVYQIVKPVYATGVGLEKWEEAADYNDKLGTNTTDPFILDSDGKFVNNEGKFYFTETKIGDLAAAIIDGSVSGLQLYTLTYNDAEKCYINTQVAPGMYIVLVKPDANDTDTVYNPAIASIYYSTEEVPTYAESDAGTYYKKTATDDYILITDYDALGAEAKAEYDITKKYAKGDDATNNILAMQKILDMNTDWENISIAAPVVVVKHSDITIEKEITNNSKGDPAQDSAKHGDDHGKDDIVYFKGTTKVPMFADTYFEQYDAQNKRIDPIYKLIDEMSDGLKLVQDKDVFNNGTDANTDDDYVIKISFLTDKNDATTVQHTVTIEASKLAKGKTYEHHAAGGHTHVVTLNDLSDSGFEFQWNGEAIKSHRGQWVTVEYAAYVDISKFDPGFVADTNDFKVEFSNNPKSLNETKTLTDRTYHYTFNIDGSISGNASEGQRQGHELIKTTEENFDWVSGTDKKVIKYKNGNSDAYARLEGNRFYEADATAPYNFKDKDGGTSFATFDPDKVKPAVIWSETTYTTTGINGLNDAEFTLTMTKNDKGEPIVRPTDPTAAADWEAKYVQVVSTANGGYMTFTGLDAGTYTLKETKAPAGYSPNTDEYEVIISAEYFADKVEDAGEKWIISGTNTAADGKEYATEVEAKAALDAAIDTAAQGFDYNAYLTYVSSQEAHEKGQLKSYKVERKLNGADAGTTTYTYSKTGGVKETFTDTIGTTFIKNTKMPELPSTGGMGTYLFTIAGVAILGVAAFMLIFKRRRA